MNERITITVLAAMVVAALALPAAAGGGAMDEYYRLCGGPLASMETMPACGALADRLESVASPTREERLAGLRSRSVVDNDDAAFCAGLGRHLHLHPDDAEALVDQAITCTDDTGELAALLHRALDIDPSNYHALSSLLWLAWVWGQDMGVDAESLASHRATLYEVAKARAAMQAAEFPRGFSSFMVWQDVLGAARYIVDEADRAGDPRAADAIRARVRRDAGLDDLDFGSDGPCDGWENCPRGERGDSLDLACQPLLLSIGLEDICLSAVTTLASAASAAGTAIPGDVLRAASVATRKLRGIACEVLHGSTAASPAGNAVDGCDGPAATESPGVARLRAVLEHHGGPWSSEHHRVYAQGFLGDNGRRPGRRRRPVVSGARAYLGRYVAALIAVRSLRGSRRKSRGFLGISDTRDSVPTQDSPDTHVLRPTPRSMLAQSDIGLVSPCCHRDSRTHTATLGLARESESGHGLRRDSWTRTIAILRAVGHLSALRSTDAMARSTIRRAMQRAGVAISPHGFRSTFRTWARECGENREAAEISLSHRSAVRKRPFWAVVPRRARMLFAMGC